MTQTKNTQELGLVLSIDVGSSIVGVASGNTMAKLATPEEPVRVSESIIEAVKQAISAHNPDAVLIGLPRNLEGNDTQQTDISRDLIDQLKETIDQPIYAIDEAGSTQTAKERLGNDERSLDSEAAAVFLEDFLMADDYEVFRV